MTQVLAGIGGAALVMLVTYIGVSITMWFANVTSMLEKAHEKLDDLKHKGR